MHPLSGDTYLSLLSLAGTERQLCRLAIWGQGALTHLQDLVELSR